MSEGPLAENIFLVDERVANGIRHFFAGSIGGTLNFIFMMARRRWTCHWASIRYS